LAEKFLAATGQVRNSILQEASLLASTAGEKAKYYIRVMQKVVDSSEAYLEKESKRLDPSRECDIYADARCSLKGILAKRTLAPSKLDEIKIKTNIINAFSEGNAEEGIAQKDTAEL
jgi:protein disulfide-isomerase A6